MRSLRPALLLRLLACTILAIPTAARSDDVATLVDAIDGARLAGGGVDAADRAYDIGRLSLRFTEGRMYPVYAGERLVAGFFLGDGMMEYTSVDPFERANLDTNVRRVTGYRAEDGVIRDGLNAALIWDPDGVSAFLGGLLASDGQPPESAVNAFRKRRERADLNLGIAPELDVARSLLEPGAAKVVPIELDCRSERLYYEHDAQVDATESLSVLVKISSGAEYIRRMSYAEILSAQPIGRGRLETPSPRYVLSEVDVEVVNSSGENVVIDAIETFTAQSSTATLDLDLWSRRVTDREHRHHLDAVTRDDGAPLPFVHRYGRVLVGLPATLREGESVKVRFRISGDSLYRPDGDRYWQLPTSSWIPLPSRLNMQSFTYRAVVKVPKPWIAFSIGTTVRRWEEGSLACAEFREDHPTALPTILAGRYSTYSLDSSELGIRVTVASYADDNSEKRLRKIAENSLAIIEFYQKLLGDYPYDELKLVEINSFGFAQAPAGLIYITRELYDSALQSGGWSEGINSRLAHEIAHTWWGHVVKWSDDQDQWLSESLADYYAEFAMSMLTKKLKWKDSMQRWRSQSAFVNDHSSILLANQIAGEKSGDERVALLYGKGPLVLHALREEIGDEQFFTVWKSLMRNFQFKHVDTDTAIRMTNFVTKRDLGPFYETYLMGTAWPDKSGRKKK